MRRFFPRLFFVIWLGALLIGASVTLIDAFANPSTRLEEHHNLEVDALRLEAIEVMKEASRGARPTDRLRRFRERTGATIYLFRDDGLLFAPKTPPTNVRDLAARVRAVGRDVEERHENGTLVGLTLPNSRYVAVGRVLRTPAWARALGEDQPAIRITLLVLASALLALLLANYLVRPVRSLRRATRRIAEGDLAARVGPQLDHGVLAELGEDFDTMAARVEALIEARERLLSDVSHELNSPLARLRVALELARGKAGEGAQAPLDRIEREAERLAALVDEILTLTRLDRAEGIERASVDLRAVVLDVARDAAFEARASEADVRLGEVADARLEGDVELLRRALDNVVRNALRFTAEGTAVEVSMSRDGDEARVRVRDHGPGVPDDALARIFEPLYRVEPDRGRSTGGAGLGLAIARRGVALHGGRIEARNADGGGLEVCLTLPLATLPPVTPPAKRVSANAEVSA